MRASVAGGGSDFDAIEKSRDAFEDWLHSGFDEAAKVYSAEELDLRRALKMEA